MMNNYTKLLLPSSLLLLLLLLLLLSIVTTIICQVQSKYKKHKCFNNNNVESFLDVSIINNIYI